MRHLQPNPRESGADGGQAIECQAPTLDAPMVVSICGVTTAHRGRLASVKSQFHLVPYGSPVIVNVGIVSPKM